MREIQVVPYYVVLELNESEKNLLENLFTMVVPKMEVEIYPERILFLHPFLDEVILHYVKAEVGLTPEVIKLSKDEKTKRILVEFKEKTKISYKDESALVVPSLIFSFGQIPYSIGCAFLGKKFYKKKERANLEFALEVIGDALVLLAQDEAIGNNSNIPAVSNESKVITVSPPGYLSYALDKMIEIIKMHNIEVPIEIKKHLHEHYTNMSPRVRKAFEETYERELEKSLRKSLQYVRYIT